MEAQAEKKPYGLHCELEFIKGLGFGRAATSRREMLVNYISAARLRKNWDGLSKPRCIAFAEECLRNLNNR